MPLPQHRFIAPNQLLEVRTDGACILQVVPTVAGRSRLRRFDFSRDRGSAARPRGARAQRQATVWLSEQIALAESTQGGLEGATELAAEGGATTPALARFRAQVGALLQGLPQESGAR